MEAENNAELVIGAATILFNKDVVRYDRNFFLVERK